MTIETGRKFSEESKKLERCYYPMVNSFSKLASALLEFRNSLRVTYPLLSYTWAVDQEVWVSGREASYMVRSGLAPEYTESPDKLVQQLLKGSLPPEVRARLAAAAIRGWVSSYKPEAPEVLAWHRLVGDSVLVVTHA